MTGRTEKRAESPWYGKAGRARDGRLPGVTRRYWILGASLLRAADAWQTLFDGKSLAGWKETAFPRKGAVSVAEGRILLGAGAPLTGITYTGPFPRTNYEVRYEAMRVAGGDFFASLTFPVGDSFATFVLGGWGGDIIGVSSIDGWNASENETRNYFTFEDGKWYPIRVAVAPERIECWIGAERVVNVGIAGRQITMRPGDIERSAPLGIASYNTTGAVRQIEYRTVTR